MKTTTEKPRKSPPLKNGRSSDRGIGPRRHQATKFVPLTREALDGRSNAAKTFDKIVCGVENDLGGRDQLSTVQAALIAAFAGATIHVNQMNALLLIGQAIDLADHAAAISAMVRVASRLGTARLPKNVTPSVQDYVRHVNAEEAVE
jgi:hypothetical protein